MRQRIVQPGSRQQITDLNLVLAAPEPVLANQQVAIVRTNFVGR